MENKYPFSGVKGRAKKNLDMAVLRGLEALLCRLEALLPGEG
jgi:hypothetical protein